MTASDIFESLYMNGQKLRYFGCFESPIIYKLHVWVLFLSLFYHLHDVLFGVLTPTSHHRGNDKYLHGARRSGTFQGIA